MSEDTNLTELIEHADFEVERTRMALADLEMRLLAWLDLRASLIRSRDEVWDQ